MSRARSSATKNVPKLPSTLPPHMRGNSFSRPISPKGRQRPPPSNLSSSLMQSKSATSHSHISPKRGQRPPPSNLSSSLMKSKSATSHSVSGAFVHCNSRARSSQNTRSSKVSPGRNVDKVEKCLVKIHFTDQMGGGYVTMLFPKHSKIASILDACKKKKQLNVGLGIPNQIQYKLTHHKTDDALDLNMSLQDLNLKVYNLDIKEDQQKSHPMSPRSMSLQITSEHFESESSSLSFSLPSESQFGLSSPNSIFSSSMSSSVSFTERKMPPPRKTMSRRKCSRATTQDCRKSGFLQKKNDRSNKWIQRFFVIREGALYYYIDEDTIKSRGKYELRDVKFKEIPKGKQHNIVLTKGGKDLIRLAAENEREKKEWLAALELGREDAVVNEQTRNMWIEKEGWMSLRIGREKGKRYRYWFILSGSRLFYYKNNNDTNEPKGTIDLSQGYVVEESTMNKSIGFYIVASIDDDSLYKVCDICAEKYNGTRRIASRSWQRKEDIAVCPICNAGFSLTIRKHHCRQCGRVICSNCATQKVPITIVKTFYVIPESRQQYKEWCKVVKSFCGHAAMQDIIRSGNLAIRSPQSEKWKVWFCVLREGRLCRYKKMEDHLPPEQIYDTINLSKALLRNSTSIRDHKNALEILCSNLNQVTSDEDHYYLDTLSSIFQGNQRSRGGSFNPLGRPSVEDLEISVEVDQELKDWMFDIAKAIPDKVFGVPLTMAVDRNENNLKIPQPIIQATQWLNKYGLCEEGLYRIPGSKSKVEKMIDSFDRGEPIEIPKLYSGANLASLIVQFLKRCPESIFTDGLTSVFRIFAQDIKEVEIKDWISNEMAHNNEWCIGDQCLAQWDDNNFYPAEIAEISHHVTKDIYKVKFSGYGDSYKEISVDQMAPRWKVDDKCMAQWEDGQYYFAEISDVIDEAKIYLVNFPKYDQTAEMTLNQLRTLKNQEEEEKMSLSLMLFKKTIQSMPFANQETLKMLASHLRKVALNSLQNNMTPDKLAMCVNSNMAKSLQICIVYYRQIFLIPSIEIDGYDLVNRRFQLILSHQKVSFRTRQRSKSYGGTLSSSSSSSRTTTTATTTTATTTTTTTTTTTIIIRKSR